METKMENSEMTLQEVFTQLHNEEVGCKARIARILAKLAENDPELTPEKGRVMWKTLKFLKGEISKLRDERKMILENL